MASKLELTHFNESTEEYKSSRLEISQARYALKQAGELFREGKNEQANHILKQVINILKAVSITAPEQKDRDHAMALLLMIFSRTNQIENAEQCLKALTYQAEKNAGEENDWFLKFYSLILTQEPIFPAENGDRANEIYYVEEDGLFVRIDENYHILAIHETTVSTPLSNLTTLIKDIATVRKNFYFVLDALFKIIQPISSHPTEEVTEKNGKASDSQIDLESWNPQGYGN